MTNLRLSQRIIPFISYCILTGSALMVIGLYLLVSFETPGQREHLLPVVPHKATQTSGRPFQEITCEATSAVKPAEKNKVALISVKSSAELSALFDSQKYTLETNEDGQVVIPPLYLAKLPQDFNKKIQRQDRQELFVQALLPLVLDANHEIMKERKELLKIQDNLNEGEQLTDTQQSYLDKIAQKYKVASSNLRLLLKRVDVIPPSLALAQAIEETGWGTSYAARNKNSTFGITLSTGVKAYENLYASVRGYVLNLNSNPAYADMRQIRHELRQEGKSLCSEKLMGGLHRYSELRNAYIQKVRNIIRRYDLKRFDSAQLQTM